MIEKGKGLVNVGLNVKKGLVSEKRREKSFVVALYKEALHFDKIGYVM